MNWFRHIRVVTADDKADFEVMLLDHANIEDAKNALLGISMNLIEHGLNLGLMDLLLDAADIKNVFQIRNFALNVLISMMAIYDDAIRKQEDLVDRFLDILADDPELPFLHMCLVGKVRNHIFFVGHTVKPTKDTLVFQLTVVGEDANQAFDRSCC